MTDSVQSIRPSPVNQIRFSVAAHAAWAPGRETPAAWRAWAAGAPCPAPGTEAGAGGDPALSSMPAMLRRRASPAGKMALQAAYAAYPASNSPDSIASVNAVNAVDSVNSAAGPERRDIPVIFCSRHGECGRSADLLIDLARGLPLSPAAFSLSVHNATGGLFSIARHDHANSLALAAGRSTVEHAAIEACSLLADGAPAVLLAVADGPLPPMYREFADCDEQPFGWAWLITAAQEAGDAQADAISLCWSAGGNEDADAGAGSAAAGAEPGALQVMRFFLNGDASLQRHADRRVWTWRRDGRPQ